MKTYKNLYPRICALENLHAAFRQARRSKRARPDVAAFEFNLDLELPLLQDELLAGTYRPGGYRHFTRSMLRAGQHPRSDWFSQPVRSTRGRENALLSEL